MESRSGVGARGRWGGCGAYRVPFERRERSHLVDRRREPADPRSESPAQRRPRGPVGSAMTELSELQRQMELTYGARDRARGIPATVAWLAEEVGELAKAVRKGSRDERLHE